MKKHILINFILAISFIGLIKASDLIVPYSHFAERYSSAVKIIQLADSNFLILSRHKDIGSYPAMAGLTWCRQNGDTIKTKLLSLNSSSAILRDIISLYDGTLFISGTTDDPLDNTLFTLHIDSSGSVINFKLHTTIDAVWPSNSIQLDSGKILLAATLINLPESMIYYKVNPDGDSISSHRYSFPGLLGVTCNRLLNDSTIAYGGDMRNSNFVFFTNLNGDSLSIRNFPFATSVKSHISSFAIVDSQYLVIAGTSTDTLDGNHQSIWVMKSDLSGALLWENRFHSTNTFWNSSAISEIGTNYFAINTFYNTATTLGNHPPVLIIDANGDSVSTSMLNGNYCETNTGNNSSIIGDMNGNAFLTTIIDSACSNIYQNITFEKLDFSTLFNSIDILNDENEFDVFPNPSLRNNTVSIRHNFNHTKIQVISSDGKFCRENIIDDGSIYPMRLNFPSGVYFILLQDESGSTVRKLLIGE